MQTLMNELNQKFESKKRNILLKKSLKCMKSRHSKANSNIRVKCFNCQSFSHHSTLCKNDVKEKVKDDNKNNLKNSKVDQQEDQHSFLVRHNQTVLLQTAEGIITNVDEGKSKSVHIMFDTSTQGVCI